MLCQLTTDDINDLDQFTIDDINHYRPVIANDSRSRHHGPYRR